MISVRTLRRVLEWGVCLSPLIVLFHIDVLLFPMATEKGFLFRIYAEVLFLVWLALVVRDPKTHPQWSPVLLSFGVFLSILAIADLTGIDRGLSFWSSYERMGGFVLWAHLAMFFVIAGSVLKRHQLWVRFLYVQLITETIVVGIGLLEYFGWYGSSDALRITSVLGNASFLASYLLLQIVLVFYKLSETPYLLLRQALVALAGIEFFVLGVTASRGAVLGLFATIIAVALIMSVAETTSVFWRRVSITVVTIFLILIAGVISVRGTIDAAVHPILARYLNVSLDEGSAEARRVIWDMAWQGVKERPVLGWGQENFPYVFDKYYDTRLHRYEPWFDRTHNIFIEWLVSSGFVGLVAFILFLASAIYTLWWRVGNRLGVYQKALLTGFVVAYVVQGMFTFDVLPVLLTLFAVLGYIHALGGSPLPRAFHNAFLRFRTVIVFCIIAVILSLMVAGVMVPLITNYMLMKGYRLSHIDPSAALDYFKQAFRSHLLGWREAREWSVYRANAMLGERGVDPFVKREYTDLANTGIGELADDVKLAKYPLIAAMLAANTGDIETAQTYYEDAIARSPHKDRSLIQYGATLQRYGKYDEARSLFRSVLQDVPHHPEATRLLIEGAIAEGGDVEREVFAEVSPSVQVAVVYRKRGEYERMREEWERILAESPDNLQLRVTYASELSAAGQYEHAIEVLRDVYVRVADLDAKREIEEYIAQVKRREREEKR